MSGGTHAERILGLLAQRPGLNDDEVATALGIEPRQTVNQVCRRLAAQGVLIREPGDSGKIVNKLSSAGAASPMPAARRPTVARKSNNVGIPDGRSLVPADLAKTLLVIPCSKAKQDRIDLAGRGDGIARYLPAALGQELLKAREDVRSKAPVNETTLVPAWQRYDGALYRTGRQALADLRARGAHIVILSGGYGAVLAAEPIGMYNAVLKPGWWRNRILERVLIAYAKRHELSSVRAFASETSAYRHVLQRVPWHAEGIHDALLLVPEAQAGGTFKSPASLGEALGAMNAGSLTADWRSSYGLGFTVHPS